MPRGGTTPMKMFVIALAIGVSASRLARADDSASRTDAPAETPADERPVSLKRFVPDVLHDQGKIWSFPLELAKGRHLEPALAFAATTATLIVLDPRDTPYFRRTQSFQGFNKVFSGTNTDLAIMAVPTAFLLEGLTLHDTRAQRTSFRAFEAFADVEILDLALKATTGRLRPSDISPTGDFSDSWFKYKGLRVGATSFPSGHTIAAFAVATVVADHSKKTWVKVAAYGLASVIGFSRVTLQAHFPSDVFAGAVLGYATAHYVVPRP
jgi:membrane-associated phospholipid phosphatase